MFTIDIRPMRMVASEKYGNGQKKQSCLPTSLQKWMNGLPNSGSDAALSQLKDQH